jgi:uncharacterized YceG family protein
MAERPPRVRYHRRPPTRAGRLAPLVGALLAVGVLAAIGWGFATALGGDEQETVPPTGTTVPQKPVLRIIFPEGFTRAEMAQRIAEVNKIAKQKRKITPSLSPQAYLRNTRKGALPDGFDAKKITHLEGFLFPATYDFTEDTTSKALVRKQLDAFKRAWENLDLDFAAEKSLTPYDILIIASMIEEEVQVPKERPLVAAVIYNRLRLGMTLGIDATIRYGLGVPPTEPLRESQLADPTPYNTRIHTGLPPTPISNPGLAAMQAAAHPAEVGYLFFVRNSDCKTHFFTENEQEFLNRVAGPRC